MKNEMVTSGIGYENGWIKYNIDWFVLDIGICCYCLFLYDYSECAGIVFW